MQVDCLSHTHTHTLTHTHMHAHTRTRTHTHTHTPRARQVNHYAHLTATVSTCMMYSGLLPTLPYLPVWMEREDWTSGTSTLTPRYWCYLSPRYLHFSQYKYQQRGGSPSCIAPSISINRGEGHHLVSLPV